MTKRDVGTLGRGRDDVPSATSCAAAASLCRAVRSLSLSIAHYLLFSLNAPPNFAPEHPDFSRRGDANFRFVVIVADDQDFNSEVWKEDSFADLSR